MQYLRGENSKKYKTVLTVTKRFFTKGTLSGKRKKKKQF